MRRLCLVCTVGQLLLVAALLPAVRAEGGPGKDLFEMTLEELLQVEVTTASGIAESAALAPAAMTVFTADDLQRMGILWLDELMPYLPGGQGYHRVGNSVHYWLPLLRGAPDHNGQGVLLLRDGVRQSATALSVYTGLRRLSLAGIERVEIIRGPGAAIYGANALYGVINLLSRDLPEQLILGGGELGARALSVRKSLGQGDWGLTLAARHYADQGEHYTGITDRNQRQNTTNDAMAQSEAEMALSYRHWRLQFAQREAESDDYYQFSNVAYDWNYADTRSRRAQLELRDWALGPVSFSLVAGRGREQQQFAVLVAAQGSAPPFASADWLALVETSIEDEALSAQFQLSQNGALWSAGVDWERARAATYTRSNYDLLTLQYLQAIIPRPYNLLPDAEREFVGIYGQYQQHWDTGLGLTLGLRRDDYDDIGAASSPRLALSFDGWDGQIWKLIYTEAFRAPNFQELHLANNPRVLGNPDLSPVLLRNQELSWAYVGSQFSSEISLFQSQERDRVVAVPISAQQTLRMNAASLDTSGIEWLWRWHSREAWHFALAGSHIFKWQEDLGGAVGEDRTADLLPRHLYTLSVDWRSGAWTAHAAWHYVAATEVLADDTPYSLGRLALNYQWSAQQTLALAISNLADTDYFHASDSIGLGTEADGRRVRAVPQRGRQALLSWRYQW